MAVVLYLLLVLAGLICVASAGYDDMIDSFFSIKQNHVKQATAPYKYPRIVVFRDELPKTTSGKIQRNKL